MDLPDVPEIIRVRVQCLRLQFGSVRIGSVWYVGLCDSAVGNWDKPHPTMVSRGASTLFSCCKDEDATMHQESGEHGRTVGQGQHTIEKCSSIFPKGCLLVDDPDAQCWQSAQDPVDDKRITMLFWSTIDSAH